MARQAVADDKIRMISFFGGSENQITSQQFRGGRVYAVFGSSDIDLRRATIADEGATINIIAIFGKVKLLVPEDWGINIQTRAIFGGVASKRVAPTSPRGPTHSNRVVSLWRRGDKILKLGSSNKTDLSPVNAHNFSQDHHRAHATELGRSICL